MDPGPSLLLTGTAWSITSSLFALATHDPTHTTNFHYTVDGNSVAWVLLLTQLIGYLAMLIGGLWTVIGSVT